ncbi:hypothetical protein OTSKATO_0233 [Orientia tsutsugamushi str. Kato PP]|uniref:Uncharacterized protein n=1 Tax=Orientia tsutsugamushi TaxID=784 RepID=A0A2U3QQA3_ORITS|nr:hypothetical protein OTSKATO_0233 [Orientia tsutsugamushi str. Kato PP]SPR03153.1 Uncharacterised protein [Orientia tsutsugamushi]
MQIINLITSHVFCYISVSSRCTMNKPTFIRKENNFSFSLYLFILSLNFNLSYFFALGCFIAFFIPDLLTPNRLALSCLYTSLYCDISSVSLSIEIFIGGLFLFFFYTISLSNCRHCPNSFIHRITPLYVQLDFCS